MRYLFALLLLLAMLSGCGQKGPLYLPQDDLPQQAVESPRQNDQAPAHHATTKQQPAP